MPDEIADWVPADFSRWPAAKQAVLIVLSTFVSEDFTCIGAALLAGVGALPQWIAGTSVFVGIWLGDALLYGLARGAGFRLRRWGWLRRRLNSPRVREAETWFQKRGWAMLWLCRAIPGARLPTYLAAGVVRLPVLRFLAITGAAALLWTAAIFLVVAMVGVSLGDWLRRFENGFLGLLAVAVLLFFGIRLLQRRPLLRTRWRFWKASQAIFGRWSRWEFWPAWLFYLPVVLDYLRLGLRHRDWTLPSAANPGMETGGMIGESKLAVLKTLQRIAPDFTAEAVAVSGQSLAERRAAFQRLMEERHWTYPVVIKPDVGQRGSGVRKVSNLAAAEECLKVDGFLRIAQRYVPGPREAGIFYYRRPQERKGRIFAITHKVFPKLIGDGRRTLRELIQNDERAGLIAAVYRRRFQAQWDRVLAAGEPLRLVEAGNHAQGCVFKDGAFLYSRQLEERVDQISRQVPGFYFGRYDVRYESESLLKAGQKFQIVELNGASAEATNIYDPDHSLLDAYKILHRQWEIVFAIGAANRKKGAKTDSLWRLWKAWRRCRNLSKRHLPAD